MASYINLIDIVAQGQSGPMNFKSGATISDPTAIATIPQEGGILWPTTDPIVAAAATIVTKLRGKGLSDENYCSRVMLAAAASSLSQGDGSLPVSGITAGTTRTQAGATVLTGDVNRVDTSTAPSTGAILGDGVVLPASSAGKSIVVVNNTANNVQLYANGTDTINGVAGSTGVALPPGDVVICECAAAGAWNASVGLGNAGALATQLSADSVSAAGTGQSTATQLGALINNVTTVGAGTGVNLPASAKGLEITIENNGANPLTVYPFQGSSDTINGGSAGGGIVIHAGTCAVFNCTAAGVWYTQPASPVQAAYNTNTATSGTTLTAANVTGGVSGVDLAMTGTLTAGANAQLPTAANLIAALHAPTVGTSYRLRIANRSSGAYNWTVTTNTGITLVDTTATIAQNTWCEYVVQVTAVGASPAVTVTAVARGTYS